MRATAHTPSPRRGALLAVVSAAFAAVFLIAFRVANRSAPRETTVLVMLTAAMALNVGFALVRARRRPRRPSRTTVTAVGVLAALTILGNTGVAGALGYIDPGLTSTVLQTQVFVVGLGGWLFLGERITARLAVGACFAFAGFVVLGVDDPSGATVDAAGVGFALLGSVAFGGMLVYTRKVITRIDPVGVNAARLVLAVVAMGAFAVPRGALDAVDAELVALCVVAALSGPFVSRLCLMYAVKDLSASRVKLLTLLSPVFAFALEALFFGSLPSLRELAGGALILLGVGAPVLARAQRRAAADAG